MVDIRPNALPDAILPLRSGDAIIVDQGADGVRQTDPISMTDSVAPVATQSEAQTGTDNTKRMTPLRTKQSIASEVGVTIASKSQGDKADSAVQSVNGKTGNSVTLVKGDVGLGNVDNTSDANKPISTATQAALDLKANSAVTISAGTGLTGGGTLSANRTIALNSTSIASLAKADSSVQTVNGIAPTSGNVTIAANELRLQDTVSSASLISYPSDVLFIVTSGYSVAGDLGGGTYKRVASEPSHAGKFQSSNGVWFELFTNEPNFRQFGAKGDGVTDDYQSIMNAIAYVNSKGGGELYTTRGVFAHSQPIYLGDGSNTQVSTRDHRISIIGQGTGGDDGLDFVQSTAPTEFLYTGPQISQSSFQLRGPIKSLFLSGFTINSNGNAVGLEVNHVTNSVFSRVVNKKSRIYSLLLTTRNGFPPGCAYGCGNNSFYDCFGVQPATVDTVGVKLTSGVSTAVSLTGQPDSANNDFIGGAFFYGSSANSRGVHLHGADNNTFSGTQFIKGATPSFGFSVFFEQWAGDTRFPMENVFDNCGMNDPVGGASGTLGNIFTNFQEGDGAVLPLMPYVSAFSHSGVRVINGVRSYGVRRTSQKLDVTSRSTNSNTYVLPSSNQSILITNVLSGSKLRVTFNAKVGKVTGGAGNFIIYRNGISEPSTEREIPFNIAFQSLSMSILLDVPSTSDQTIEIRYKSTDANNVSINNAVFLVEELF